MAGVIGAFATDFAIRSRAPRDALSGLEWRSPWTASQSSGMSVQLTSDLADALRFDPRPILKTQAGSVPSPEALAHLSNQPLEWDVMRLKFSREMLELESLLLYEQSTRLSPVERLLILSLQTHSVPPSVHLTEYQYWRQVEASASNSIETALNLLRARALQNRPTEKLFLCSLIEKLLPLHPDSRLEITHSLRALLEQEEGEEPHTSPFLASSTQEWHRKIVQLALQSAPHPEAQNEIRKRLSRMPASTPWRSLSTASP